MSTNATGVRIQKIHATLQGRIFMIGDDYNLWELDYRREEGWFTGRCYKKLHNSSSLGFISSWFNHSIIDICSNSTGTILYQLTQQATIAVTCIENGTFYHFVSQNDICKQLQGAQLVSIYATSPNESRKYQLVGVTNAGHRLYFTIYKNELKQDIPDTLDLLHVRPPPNGQAGASVSKALYQDAVYLAVRTNPNNNVDELIGSNPDIGHLSQTMQHSLVEFAASIPISGRILALESVPMAGYDDYQINEIAAPSTISPKQFLVLTTTGLFVLMKQRPIDMFQRLLMHPASGTPTLSEELRSFTKHFGVANTSAFSFGIVSDSALACTKSNSHNDNHISSPGIISGAKAVLQRLKHHTEDPSINQDGLALFIHRTIRPIWENPMFKQDNTSLNPPCQLQNTLETLRHLSNNIKENVNMTPEIEAMKELVNYLCQAIAFFLYLFESDSNAILNSIQPDVHARLCTITLNKLLTSNDGRALVDRLTNLLLDYEFKKNQNITFVLDSLEQHCGDFCGAMDVTVTKIINKIESANTKETMNPLFMTINKVAAHLSHPQLYNINTAFVQHGLPEYAVDLTLTCINTHSTPVYYDLFANLLLTLQDRFIKQGLYVQNRDLHCVVYNKFMESGRGSDLIKASPLYLEEYLKSENTIEKLNLLAQYYKSNERYQEAATTLVHLARLPGGLSMNRRVELLNDAYQCTQRVTAPTKQYEMYELGQSIQGWLSSANASLN
ncbi:hypothetical protein K501DRAFT_283289 [Backusella circina FSU 941]|nr:hypothetical protein K501DRAFT_283289 [Backusella circina FSU 941]